MTAPKMAKGPIYVEKGQTEANGPLVGKEAHRVEAACRDKKGAQRLILSMLMVKKRKAAGVYGVSPLDGKVEELWRK